MELKKPRNPMEEWFVRWEAPWSRMNKKYRVVEKDGKFVIQVKPSWRKKYIFDSSVFGKYYDTKVKAIKTLHILAVKFFHEGYAVEWGDDYMKRMKELNGLR